MVENGCETLKSGLIFAILLIQELPNSFLIIKIQFPQDFTDYENHGRNWDWALPKRRVQHNEPGFERFISILDRRENLSKKYSHSVILESLEDVSLKNAESITVYKEFSEPPYPEQWAITPIA